MMAIYPPIIPGSISPMYIDQSNGYEGKKIILNIPYDLGRVAKNQIKGFSLAFKSIPLGNNLYTLQYTFDSAANDYITGSKEFKIEECYINDVKILTSMTEEQISNIITKSGNLKFVLSAPEDLNMYLGEYYKIQLAFIDNIQKYYDDNTGSLTVALGVGYYSTVTIVKYTIRPTLTLVDNIVGKYSNPNDLTEILHKGYFILYDYNNKIIEQSGEINENYFDGENYIQTYDIKAILRPGYEYRAVWKIITNNGLELEQEKIITSNEYIQPDYLIGPTINLDYDNGTINISLCGYNNQGEIIDITENNRPIVLGDYSLYRASSIDNFQTWQHIVDFDELSSNLLNQKNLIQDYNIQFGERYKYKVVQLNRNISPALKSLGLESQIITADFDSLFLCDEYRHLRIAFNPKVSTYKNVILESKQDTIGGQYPYFFRNDQVMYKEFNIQGLISYLTDPNNLFNFSGYNNETSTNLSSRNFYKEKLFRDEVLSWLTNGQPKLLKAPAEGNYYVRLMNVSLSPNDQLSRMLYNFTATAYEIDKNLKPLYKNNYKQLKANQSFFYTIINPETNIDFTDKNIREIIFSNTGLEATKVEIQTKKINGTSTSTYTFTFGEMGYHYITPKQDILLSLKFINKSDDLKLDIIEEIVISDGSNNEFKSLTNSSLENIVLNEIIGNTSPYTSDLCFYKYAQILQKNYTDNNTTQINTITYIDSTGQKKEIIIRDQLLLENQFLKVLTLGDNLELQYCRYERGRRNE